MWNIREGTVVRDLLTEANASVWQVVFEGRYCVSASTRDNATMLDVWNFGTEGDEDCTELPSGMYDDDTGP